METIKLIEGLECAYYIDIYGNVYNSDLIKMTIHGWGKSSHLDGSKYQYITLKGKSFLVHRLVAKAFIPNPDNLPQVNHKDGNRSNNFVGNLEWCSARYNQIHKRDVLGWDFSCANNNFHKLTEEEVLEITNLLKLGYTHRELAAMYNVCKSTITFINNGSTWKKVTNIDNETYHCSRRKLTESDVREIRRLGCSGQMTNSQLAKKFGVTRGTINNIKHRRIWKDLE